MSDTTALTSGTVDSQTIKIGDTDVTLPNRFASMVGQPLTEELAKIVFTHVAGQFRNNQVANAKARADRYAKAATDEERALNTPLDAMGYLKIWSDYMPNVGEGPRQSSLDKMRLEAAKRAWFRLIADHNEAVSNGGTAILKSAGKVSAAPRPVKTKAVSTEAHEAAVAEWQDAQERIYRRLLDTPSYQERIQVELDAITAEQGKKKAEAETAEAGADLI